MKNQFIASILLLVVGCVASQAQVPTDEWSVFDFETGQVDSVEVSVAVPKAVVGPDDREDKTGRASKWEKAVVVLEMDGGLCSGSMVGPNIVLTAAHCLNHRGKYVKNVNVYAVGMPSSEDAQPQPPSLIPPAQEGPNGKTNDSVVSIISKHSKRGGKNKSLGPVLDRIVSQHSAEAVATGGVDDIIRGLKKGGYPSSSSRQVWVPSDWINLTKNKSGETLDINKEETYDYGIVILEKSLGRETGWLNLSVPTDKELKGAEIVVIGRGGDKPRRSLWSAKGRVGKVYKRYFFHNADMVAGNSGGPIVNVNNRSRIIALNNFDYGDNHVSGGYPNGGLRITNNIISAVAKAGN